MTKKSESIVYIVVGWSLLSKIAPVSILRGCRIDEQSQNLLSTSERCLYSETAVLTKKVRIYCLHRSGLVFTEQDCASVYTPRLPY
ncbi:hypothetical protein J6590_023028 [Homalodisca vitripennis]|nr:hypothetical protein J6590_023028 [Homalodisca vitripennis]